MKQIIYEKYTNMTYRLRVQIVIKILFEKVMKPNKTIQTGPIENKLFSCQPLFEIRQNSQTFSIHMTTKFIQYLSFSGYSPNEIYR